jgi:hypothetical protein
VKNFGLLITASTLLLLSVSACRKGEKIEEIDSETVTTQDYNDYYSAYLNKIQYFAGIDRKTLSNMVCHPDQIPNDSAIQDLINKIFPENNFEEFHHMKIVAEVAKKEGFEDRPMIKGIMDQVALDSLIRIYMQDKINERIKITDEQINQQCQELRKQFPREMQSVSIERCREIAEVRLRKMSQKTEEEKLVSDIKDGANFKRNQKFDRNEYLKNNMPIYLSIRKEGGCPVSEKDSAKSSGELMEEITYNSQGAKITTKDFEDYYVTFVEKAARFANAEKSTLYRMICNPDQIPNDPMVRELIAKLDPQYNYEDFRMMRVIEMAAKNEDFDDKPHVRALIEQQKFDTVVRLYVQEKMDERIKISEEQKKQKCDELRRQFPKIGSLPIDNCLMIADGVLKRDIMIQEGPRLQEEIREMVEVRKNSEFSKEDFLKTQIAAFNELKKEGGCAAPEKGAQAAEEKNPTGSK